MTSFWAKIKHHAKNDSRHANAMFHNRNDLNKHQLCENDKFENSQKRPFSKAYSAAKLSKNGLF